MSGRRAPLHAHARAIGSVREALKSSDVPLATRLAVEALANGAESALLLNLRAFRHEKEGRDRDALADLRRAAELAPHDPAVLNALGLSCFRCGRLCDAIDSFDRAIAADPGFSQAHFNKGWSLEEAGDLVRARDCFLRAHEIQPGAVAPLARLASLAVRMGNWSEARTHAESALRLDPDDALAGMAMASLEMELGEFETAERRLRTLRARHHGTGDGALIDGLLGDVLHAQNRPAAAFAAYENCNQAFRLGYRSRFRERGVQSVPDWMKWISSYFERAAPGTWSTPAPKAFPDPRDPAVHVFIVGFPRSGTTLLEQVLGSHPDAITSDEKDGLSEGVREFMASPDGLDRLATLGGAGLKRHRQAYWQYMRDRGLEPAGRIFVDKQPYHTMKLPLIAKLFPEARIVLALRDPRDVVLSCFRQRFRMNPSNYELLTLEGAAGFYDQTMRLAETYRSRLPLEIHEIRHEDLVTNFEDSLRALCGFLKLHWHDDMRNFTQRPRTVAVATPSANQIARGLNAGGISQWKRYAPQMAPVLPILDPWVRRFGYA